MKTKLEMAHEWAIELLRSGYHRDDIISCAWQYADAMQDEADKRLSEATCKEEWQPDWSQAPEWAKWWAMDGFSKQGNWYDSMPYIDEDSEIEDEWNTEETYLKAPSFGYTGDWRDSLRKRTN